jgi:ribosome-binding factor A
MRKITGELLLTKLSDPRIDRARTSVTRVEVAEDLLTAKVYISVMGTEGRQNRTLQALRHASGHIQELIMRQMSLRTTPVLSFVADTEFKKTIETLNIIQRVADEIQQKDEARLQAARQASQDAGDTPAGESEQTPPPDSTNQDQRS